ncbi:hypothetical protein ABK040_006260 [Willaertia magna]
MRLERPLNNNKSNIPFCSVCDEEEWELLEESICKCKNCNLYLCDIHTKIHKKKSTTKDHTLEYLNSSSTTSSPTTTLSNNNKQVVFIHPLHHYCQEHSNQITEIKCINCKKLICLKCALYKHKEHNLIIIQY